MSSGSRYASVPRRGFFVRAGNSIPCIPACASCRHTWSAGSLFPDRCEPGGTMSHGRQAPDRSFSESAGPLPGSERVGLQGRQYTQVPCTYEPERDLRDEPPVAECAAPAAATSEAGVIRSRRSFPFPASAQSRRTCGEPPPCTRWAEVAVQSWLPLAPVTSMNRAGTLFPIIHRTAWWCVMTGAASPPEERWPGSRWTGAMTIS